MIDTGLKDKVVIVTGANNPYGIGAATAQAFAAEGAKVFITYLRISPEDYGISMKEAQQATVPGLPLIPRPADQIRRRGRGGNPRVWRSG